MAAKAIKAPRASMNDVGWSKKRMSQTKARDGWSRMSSPATDTGSLVMDVEMRIQPTIWEKKPYPARERKLCRSGIRNDSPRACSSSPMIRAVIRDRTAMLTTTVPKT